MIQDSNEWHEWRKGGVGASEAAAVMGVCPWSTKRDVYFAKKGKALFEGNFATERGKELEAKARSLYELINLETMDPATATHPEWPFLRASLDGISVDKKTILELKVPGQETHENAKKGIVSEHYMIQIQQQLLVTGADVCHFFSYSPKDESYAFVEVKPDLELQTKIVTEVSAFWNDHVLKDVPPPLTDRDTMIIENNRQIECMVISLVARKDSMPKKELDKIKAEIMSLAGHPKIQCGQVKITAVNRSGKFSYHKLTVLEAV